MDQNICPRCHQEVNELRLLMTPAVCDCCGYVISATETQAHVNMEKSVLRTALVASTVLVVTFIHVSTWGSHALEVIPLKAGDLIGALSPADMERLAEIGVDLKRHDLVEKMYSQIARANPAEYVRLGKFQWSRAKYKESAESYRRFFASGLENLDARYTYARALGETGQIDEAAKNYQYVINAKPGVRQVTVIQNYVKMLVQASRFDEAQKVIQTVRQQDPSAFRFMDTEYKVISERMKNKT